MIKKYENLLIQKIKFLREYPKQKQNVSRKCKFRTWAEYKTYLTSSLGYRYVITTYTGDRFGAGTDARVFIRLFGSKGNTKENELESSGRDNFERGQ